MNKATLNTASPSRSQPCPCGSGKKYKRCCAPQDAFIAAYARVDCFHRLKDTEVDFRRVPADENQREALIRLYPQHANLINEYFGLAEISVNAIEAAWKEAIERK